MNNNKYPMYAVAILVGGAFLIWAGIPPLLLLFVLVCPLMMFFMMRGGMHGGHGQPDSSHGEHGSTRPADLDGSHERIDRP